MRTVKNRIEENEKARASRPGFFMPLNRRRRLEGGLSHSRSRTLFAQLPLSKWNVIGLFQSCLRCSFDTPK